MFGHLYSRSKRQRAFELRLECLQSLDSFQVIMSRNYRGDIETSAIERFMTLLMEQEDEGKTSPVVQSGDISYTYSERA